MIDLTLDVEIFPKVGHHECAHFESKIADVSRNKQKNTFLQKYADVSKISKRFLIRNVHIHNVLLWLKFQHLKLSQSKVIQKISFANVSIFALFAIFIPITLFRQTQTKQL